MMMVGSNARVQGGYDDEGFLAAVADGSEVVQYKGLMLG